MERMMMNPYRGGEPKAPRSPLSINKNPHMVSNFKPKIRIIHIFAPEIIKTDVENFRELVQRLTGKPPPERKVRKKRERSVKRDESSSSGTESVKEEDVDEGKVWGGFENSGGFLGDFDGFIQELGGFPLSNSSNMDVFGEIHLC
ncbi:hypothetical protein GIB67_010363 [Kingdonia uniflora]|uniref:VQ domain-containing protein n=1 Tax=Kingdonia uniflora TaxID=39325 RepID=A0A7J7MA83_9MAGN|nr:hypothetical protein GIB67_010363 [Kingdonia uniflora]